MREVIQLSQPRVECDNMIEFLPWYKDKNEDATITTFLSGHYQKENE